MGHRYQPSLYDTVLRYQPPRAGRRARDNKPRSDQHLHLYLHQFWKGRREDDDDCG